MLTLVSISNAADDLPPRRSRGGVSLWELTLLTQSTTLMSPTTCRRAYARGRYLSRGGVSLWELTLLTLVSISNAADDLPTAAGLADVSQQFYCR